MIQSDYRGIRYTWSGDERRNGALYGVLTVPLFGYQSEGVMEEEIPWRILDLAVHKKPNRELLEHRMGKIHREYIKHIAGTNLRVLEWGCGASTLWYREQGIKVTTVEHDPVWASIIGGVMLYPVPSWPTRARDAETGGTTHILTSPEHDYIHCPGLGKFDMVIVDGVMRNACLLQAPKLLTNHGIVLLHDAQRDWYELGRKDYRTIRTLPECDDYKGPTLWVGEPL
jgi:hypothetical protein